LAAGAKGRGRHRRPWPAGRAGHRLVFGRSRQGDPDNLANAPLCRSHTGRPRRARAAARGASGWRNGGMSASAQTALEGFPGVVRAVRRRSSAPHQRRARTGLATTARRPAAAFAFSGRRIATAMRAVRSAHCPPKKSSSSSKRAAGRHGKFAQCSGELVLFVRARPTAWQKITSATLKQEQASGQNRAKSGRTRLIAFVGVWQAARFQPSHTRTSRRRRMQNIHRDPVWAADPSGLRRHDPSKECTEADRRSISGAAGPTPTDQAVCPGVVENVFQAEEARPGSAFGNPTCC